MIFLRVKHSRIEVKDTFCAYNGSLSMLERFLVKNRGWRKTADGFEKRNVEGWNMKAFIIEPTPIGEFK